MKSIAKTLAMMSLCAIGSYAALASDTPNASTQPETVKDRVGMMPMDSNLLFVFINPGEGQEDALGKFYDQHMREFMNFPNFVRDEHLHKITRKDKADPAYSHVIVFEYKGNQDESLARVQAALKDGSLGTAPPGMVAKIEGDDYAPTGPGYRRDPTGSNARVGIIPETSKLLIVLANPGEGKDAEFNAYYEQHMQDYMRLFPMFVRVQKFKVLHRQAKGDPDYKYAIVYEYTGDQDVMATAVLGAIKDGRLKLSPPGVVAKIEGNDYEPFPASAYRRVPKK